MKGLSVSHFAGVPSSDTFGSRLMALRNHEGLTRGQFAEKTGLNAEQVRRFEVKGQLSTKNEFPSCDVVARKFGVQPAWLYGGAMTPPRMWPDWWTP